LAEHQRLSVSRIGNVSVLYPVIAQAGFGQENFPRTTGQVARRFLGITKISACSIIATFENIDITSGKRFFFVGGGSLRLFHVHIRTPKEIFENPRWPKGVQRVTLSIRFLRPGRGDGPRQPGRLTPPADMPCPSRTEALHRGRGKAAANRS